MALKLYPIRLEEWQITELERRANGNPVAPFVRDIITGWLGINDSLQKEQIQKEIEGLTGQINLLNHLIQDIETKESNQQAEIDIDVGRQIYLKSNPNILKMYRDKSIGLKGYQLLQATLGFNNKSEVDEWLANHIDSNHTSST